MNKWTTITHQTADDMGESVGQILIDNLLSEKNPFWCLAAGSSPRKAYQYFTAVALRGNFSTAHLTLSMLDEWMGLGAHLEASCDHFFQEVLLRPLGILKDQYLSFNTDGELEEEIYRMQSRLKERKPFNISILGLGLNGHIGFNEPGSSIDPYIHGSSLSAHSLQHPMIDALEKKT